MHHLFIHTHSGYPICPCPPGDWNFDHSWENEWQGLPGWVGNPVVCTPQCSGLIADAMRAEASQHPDMYKFVINAGDNFYPFGVHTADSWEWEGRWGKNYAGLPRMPWYSVMGNHDLSQALAPLHQSYLPLRVRSVVTSIATSTAASQPLHQTVVSHEPSVTSTVALSLTCVPLKR